MNIVHVYFDKANSHPILTSYLNSNDGENKLSVLDSENANGSSRISRVKYIGKFLLQNYKNRNVDWYQCHDIISLILVLLLKGRNKAIFDAHEVYSGYISNNKTISKVFFFLEKALHRISKKSIFPNRSRAELFFSNEVIERQEKVFVIENLLDDKLLNGNEEKKINTCVDEKNKCGYLFLCAGTFTEIRALQEVVDSCDRLIKEGVDIQMDFVGSPNQLALQLSERYSFISLKGRVDRSVLLNSYCNYDLSFALYKPINLNNKYCAPTKLFENEYFGLPTLINKSDYIIDLLNRGVISNCIIANSCKQQHIYEAIKGYVAERRDWIAKDKSKLLWSSQKSLIKKIYD